MEIRKVLQEELQQVKLIQQKNQSVIVEFGQIELLKLDLEDRIQNAKAYLHELREEERTLAEFLEQKYGKGSIDPETGEITSL